MATAYVSLGEVVAPGILNGESSRSEAVTTSGTAASGALLAGRNQVAVIYCATAVYARSGGTATPATSVLIPATIPTAIGMTEGDAVSLIDA